MLDIEQPDSLRGLGLNGEHPLKASKHVFTMNSTTESTRPKDWKTKREIAAHFKCSARTITSLMRRRILPYVKNGRLLRIDTADCDRALSEPHRWVDN